MILMKELRGAPVDTKLILYFQNFIVERRENGHVINSRLSNSTSATERRSPNISRERSKTPTRRSKTSLTPSKEQFQTAAHSPLNRSLPAHSSTPTRRSRPLKGEEHSSATKFKQRRSQTPSRSSPVATKVHKSSRPTPMEVSEQKINTPFANTILFNLLKLHFLFSRNCPG